MAKAAPKPKRPPAPAVFEIRRGTAGRCRICDSRRDVRDWISKSLAMTREAVAERPSEVGVCDAVNATFDTAFSRTLVIGHLRKHEPNWKLWDDAEKA